MIASLSGTVAHVGIDAVVIEVGRVGLQVTTTNATTRSLHAGQHAVLFTTLVVREDSLTLFGFTEADDRDVFQTLQSVSGIGPRTAVAALSAYSADQLRAAVSQGNEASLMKISGIGRKGAQRLILELADKLGPPHQPPAASVPTAVGRPVRVDWQDQVRSALIGLGWSSREADEALAVTVTEHGDAVADGVSAEQHVSAMLAVTLRGLGRRP